MDNSNLGDRMKHNYEDVFKYRLPRRIPVIIRLDGKCFSSLTKKYFSKGSVYRIYDVEHVSNIKLVKYNFNK